jgi:protein-S-isoprenylcysteine O-methyltransferase Ste14
MYVLAGWLQRRYPGLDPLSHDAGHLWWTLTGQHGNPHFGVLHILSNLFIFGGFVLLASAWNVLYKAQREHRLATTGIYARIRHPQYVAFIAIMFGFLLQWPTILTLVMFPLLVWMYVRLAHTEERDALREMGREYEDYAAVTPRWIPHWGSQGAPTAHPRV